MSCLRIARPTDCSLSSFSCTLPRPVCLCLSQLCPRAPYLYSTPPAIHLVGNSSVPGVEALSITHRASRICTASCRGLAREEDRRGGTNSCSAFRIEHTEPLITGRGGLVCVYVWGGQRANVHYAEYSVQRVHMSTYQREPVFHETAQKRRNWVLWFYRRGTSTLSQPLPRSFSQLSKVDP